MAALRTAISMQSDIWRVPERSQAIKRIGGYEMGMLKPETINLIKIYLEQEKILKSDALDRAIKNGYSLEKPLEDYKNILLAVTDFNLFIDDMEGEE